MLNISITFNYVNKGFYLLDFMFHACMGQGEGKDLHKLDGHMFLTMQAISISFHVYINPGFLDMFSSLPNEQQLTVGPIEGFVKLVKLENLVNPHPGPLMLAGYQ